MAVTVDNECILYGIGSNYVFEALEIAQSSNIKIMASLDNLKTVKDPDIPNILTPEQITPELLKIPVTIPLITPGYRKLLEDEIIRLGFTRWANFIDRTAIIALSTSFGEGIHINAGSVIGAKCNFGKQVLINRSVSIGHHVIVEDYVTFGPACVVCGNCTIGAGSFMGAGSIILPKVTIGSNSVIGAGAVVTKDVPNNCIVVGNPAKVIKQGINGYNQVGV